MSQQVSSKPNLLFYPLRCTAISFPAGIEILPSDLQQAWNLKDLQMEYAMWRNLHYSFPWAIELFPDFPWMEALCGCTIRATKKGYTVHPPHSPFLTGNLEVPETTFLSNPWIDTFFALMDNASRWADGVPFALPSLTGPAHLLVSLSGKEGLRNLRSSDPRKVKDIIDRIASLYTAFYKRILDSVKPTSFGYIAGGCFLPSPKPLVVLKDTDWMEIQHLLPLEEMFYDRFNRGFSISIFLSTPAHALRWLEPCEKWTFTEGIIVEKNEGGLPWEDLVPLFRLIQGSGKTLVIAGPPEMEDWEFAQKDLEPENLIVLFFTTSFQEVRFWAEHLLGKDRRSL